MEAPVNRSDLLTMHPESEYHEDLGDVIWWHLPVCEPPYIGTTNDLARNGKLGTIPRLINEGWLTHFSFLPDPKCMTAADGAKISPW